MGRGIFGIDWGSTAFVINKTYSLDSFGSYFRLHKRNFQHLYYYDIEKIYLNALKNKDYKFDLLFEAMYDYKYVLDNKKYNNNYEYNRAIYLLDLVPFLDNNFLMITENTSLHAPTSVLFFEYYTNETALVENIMPIKDNLQCIVSKFEIDSLKTLRFGCTQEPSIFDFADDVNTLEFLNQI